MIKDLFSFIIGLLCGIALYTHSNVYGSIATFGVLVLFIQHKWLRSENE